MDEIKLFNRNGNKIYLKQIGEDKYELVANDAHYIRFGLTDKEDEFSFVDPDGGPFMKVGNYHIDDKLLNKIKQEVSAGKIKTILYFENGN